MKENLLPKRLSTTRNLLNQLAKEELIDIIREQMSVNKEFRCYVELKLQASRSISDFTEKEYIAMIYNLFHQHSSGYGRIIGSWASLFRSLKLVVSKIDTLKSAMLWRSYIVSVSTTLFAFDQYFTEDFIYRDHLGDKVSSHIEWAIEGLLYAAKSLAIDHANKDLCTWALDYILGVYDRLEYLPSYYSDVLG